MELGMLTIINWGHINRVLPNVAGAISTVTHDDAKVTVEYEGIKVSWITDKLGNTKAKVMLADGTKKDFNTPQTFLDYMSEVEAKRVTDALKKEAEHPHVVHFPEAEL
jgi:hypothetical protein